jgi:hypothetical protein
MVQAARQPGPADLPPAPPVPDDSARRALLRFGAVAIGVGVVLQVVMGVLHPSREPPNDSVAAFREYAASSIWTAVHIGQFAGALLIVLGLVAVARSLAGQPGAAGAAGLVGAVTAILVAAVFAVQMAVDGVALRAAIDTWVAAPPAEQPATFVAADALRGFEKGLSAFFQLLNGTTLIALGLSMTLGRLFPRWVGWVGVVAGLGALAGGTTVAHTGFSPMASTVLLAPTILGAVFLLATAVLMWRRAGARRDPTAVAAPPR